MKKELVFLLGGYDLEMLEIKKILDSKNITFHDRKLSWGARLSAYQDVFDDQNTFVAVELIEDCLPPKHYIQIDHHNEKSHLPASIEQAAKLLSIELNRFQKLVAANDRGYIPALKSAGATSVEINQIRRHDRTAQGVTEKDEELAELSIKRNLEQFGSITIVESLTPKFSTITDRLFPYEKLLIRHKNHLVYYGKGVKLLSGIFEDLIHQKMAFHGGGDDGFFGLPEGAFSNKAITEIIQEIIHKTQAL
jgi:hypothetical protein